MKRPSAGNRTTVRTPRRLRTCIVVAVAVAAGAFGGASAGLGGRSGRTPPIRAAVVTRVRDTPVTTDATVPPTTTTTRPPGAPLPLAPRPARVVWAGDSVADSLAAAIVAEAATRGVQVTNRAISGCGMVRGLPADDALVPLEIVRACDGAIPDHEVSIANTGADVITWLSTWETANRIVDGQADTFGTPEGDAKLLALIDESVQRLTANGARLVFLTVAPNTTAPRRPVVSDQEVANAAHLDQLLRRYAADHADRVSVLDLAQIVCPGGPPCPTEVDGVTLRPVDGAHFAGDGPAWVAPRVLDLLVGPQ